MTEWSDRSEREVVELLAQLREEPADNGFAAALSARLAAAAPKPAAPRWRGALSRCMDAMRVRPLWVGTCSGALSGALVFGLLHWAGGPAPENATMASVRRGKHGSESPQSHTPALCPPVAEVAAVQVFPVPAGKVALVHFQFEVEQAVEAAEFSVLLPKGLSFYSDGEPLQDRVFRWEAPLSAGENRVPVAILGELPGPHRVTATATVGSEVVVHELVLDVRGAA